MAPSREMADPRTGLSNLCGRQLDYLVGCKYVRKGNMTKKLKYFVQNQAEQQLLTLAGGFNGSLCLSNVVDVENENQV